MAKEWADHAILGWSDYAAGMPYPAQYDTWPEIDQRDYENGRMRAANYASSGQRVPHCHVTRAAYRAFTERVGAAYFASNDPKHNIPRIEDARQHQRR